MRFRTAASLALLVSLGFCVPATAASLPAIQTSSSNQVPECVTPGRLTAFLKSRNGKLAPKFEKIAMYYMRHGEELGIRWDYGFFQMLLETNNLRYTGDVKPQQNNFAGLGATGRGVRGESFADVSSGVRAHLEHVLMYTGTRIENPVADRTRKVQSWGILTKWRNKIGEPLTYTHLSRKWAPSDRGYSRDMEVLADLFFSNFCNKPDPQPDLVVEARSGRSGSSVAATKAKTTPAVTTLAPPPETNGGRASTSGASKKADAASGGATSGVDVAVINAKKNDPAKKTATPAENSDKASTAAGAGTKKKTTAAGTAKAKPANSGNCRVWTASYGGPKALIIKAVDNGVTNYTVLDVNVGREKREANAYIAAYAKGGATVGEFASPEKALKQAFQLCPEG